MFFFKNRIIGYLYTFLAQKYFCVASKTLFYELFLVLEQTQFLRIALNKNFYFAKYLQLKFQIFLLNYCKNLYF